VRLEYIEYYEEAWNHPSIRRAPDFFPSLEKDGSFVTSPHVTRKCNGLTENKREATNKI